MTTVLLTPGDPAPWFITPSPNKSRYRFSSVVARYGVCDGPTPGGTARYMQATFGMRCDTPRIRLTT